MQHFRNRLRISWVHLWGRLAVSRAIPDRTHRHPKHDWALKIHVRWARVIMASMLLVFVLPALRSVGGFTYYLVRNKAVAKIHYHGHHLVRPDDAVYIDSFSWWPRAMELGYWLANPGGPVHVPPNFSESPGSPFALTKNNSGYIFEGPATITCPNAGCFTIASGTRGTFIKSVYLGPASSAGVLLIFTNATGVGVDVGDATQDTRAVDIEGITVELAQSGVSSSTAFRFRRTQGIFTNGIGWVADGLNLSNTQVGLNLDGSVNTSFTGGTFINTNGNGPQQISVQLGSAGGGANLCTFIGGAFGSSNTSGTAFNVTNAEGFTTLGVDVESTVTGFNFNGAQSINSHVEAFFGTNTTDVIFGANAKNNDVNNLAGATLVVTDNSTNGTNTVRAGYQFASGTVGLANGTAVLPSIFFSNFLSAGGWFTTNGHWLFSNGSAAQLSIGAANSINVASTRGYGFASGANPDVAPDTSVGRAAAGVVTADTTSFGNALGTFKSKFTQIGTILTVGTLPTCNGAAEGTWAAVSDATAPTYNAALTGGGAVHVPVYCNGSAWTSH